MFLCRVENGVEIGVWCGVIRVLGRGIGSRGELVGVSGFLKGSGGVGGV